METSAKTNIQPKVCSAPKRKLARDEIDKSSAENENSEVPTVPRCKRPCKLIKTATGYVRDDGLKADRVAGAGGPPSGPPSMNSAAAHDQSVTITLAMPNRESMEHVLRCAFNEVTGMCARNKRKYPTKYLQYARDIAKVMGKSYIYIYTY